MKEYLKIAIVALLAIAIGKKLPLVKDYV